MQERLYTKHKRIRKVKQWQKQNVIKNTKWIQTTSNSKPARQMKADQNFPVKQVEWSTD